MEKITYKERKYIVDRKQDNLKNFWELTNNNQSDVKKKSIEELILKVLDDAKEIVLIRAKQLIQTSVLEKLRELKSKGVRIYAVIEKSERDDFLNFGIFRFSKNIHSSYILVDPFSENAQNTKGIWVNNPIFDNIDVFINLTGNVVRELGGLFSKEFWENFSEEIFFGERKHYTKISIEPPKIDNSLKYVSKDLEFTKFYEYEIDTVILPEEAFLDDNFVKDYMYKTENLYLPLNNISKDFLEEVIDITPNIFSGDFRFGFVKIKDGNTEEAFVFMPDLMIKIPENQKEILEKIIKKNTKWKFIKDKSFIDIKNPIILWDSEWQESSKIEIKEKEYKNIKDYDCRNIDEWLNYEKTPIPSYSKEELPLALKVILKWNIHPPYLPKDAKRHRIYKYWEDFERDTLKFIEKLKKNIEKDINQRKELFKDEKISNRDFISFKNQANSILKKLSSIENKKENWYGNKKEAQDILNQLKKLKGEFSSLIGKYEISKKEENETELEEVIPNNENNKNLKLPEIPSKPLPEVGELYEDKKKQAYLVIKFKEEIERAKEDAKKHNAKIVIKKES